MKPHRRALPALAAALLLLLSSCAATPPSGERGVVESARAATAQGTTAQGTTAQGTTASTAWAASASRSTPVTGRIFNPRSGRLETADPHISRAAVLIGDSQSAGAAGTATADTWPMQALSALGYVPRFRGRAGTGFVAGGAVAGNYLQALRNGDWLLPYGDPPLVVVQGGGNDVRIGASDEQITRNAELLLGELRRSYPQAAFVMLGTLGRGTESENASDMNRRRSEVDSLLGDVASRHNVPFISVGDWLTRYDAVPLLADKVHLKPQGHRLLAAILSMRFEELGLGQRSFSPTLEAGILESNTFESTASEARG